MDISLNQTGELCRCCSKSSNLISLFDELIDEVEIFKILMQLVPINLFKNDGLPQNICVECKSNIIQFYSFRQMCISIDESMRSNRRPVSRNNEHDYSLWRLDNVYDEFSELLIENSSLDKEEFKEFKEEDEKPPSPLVFDDTQNFDSQPMKRGTRKNYFCPIPSCNKMWITPSKLKRHLTSHREREKNSTKCPVCDLKLDSMQALSQHMKSHGITGLDQNGIEKRLAHKVGQIYVCTVCNTPLSTPLKLQYHMKMLHMLTNETHNESQKAVRKSPAECEKCLKIFPTPSKLQRHMISHYKYVNNSKNQLRKRNHECQLCQKRFETPSKLLRHSSVHRNEKREVTDIKLEISTVTSMLDD
jgi:hypothetical protein